MATKDFGYYNRVTRKAHVNNPNDACRAGEILAKNRVRIKTMEEFTDLLEQGKIKPCKLCANEYHQSE